MKLNEILDPDEVLHEAFTHPTLKITKRTRKIPTLDVAKQALLKTAQLMTVRLVSEQLQPIMQDVLDNFELMEGEHADCTSVTEWESALDDKVEEAIEPYVDMLSSDWLGNNTIDSGIHLENGVKKFSNSLAKDVYKQITYDKKPNQVLSAVGVMDAAIEEALNERLIANGKGPIDMVAPEQAEDDTLQSDVDFQEVIVKIKTRIGSKHDKEVILEEIELAIDDDEILANGAGARLGLDENEVALLRVEAINIGIFKAPLELYSIVGAYNPPTKKVAPKKAAAKAPAQAPTVAPAEAGEEEGENTPVSADVFATLKQFGGVKDAEIAKELGVSRPTYNNWVNGKTAAVLDGDQYQVVREHLVDRANTLLEALGTLDSVEPHVVN